ncbi:MAG: metal ABC transporter ATP-binding protein [Clostridia bacterium]|jgi:zinc transport system ATP-binding protein|nr:metal ABC transporter ATP-binding protein [Clostridia bacterium]
MEVIKVDNVSFGYFSQNYIIKDINMSVNEGDFLCIIGENGSGKSTLIKCILKLNKIYKGNIKVSNRIGYLPQMTEIQNNFPATIEEIILSGTIPNNIRKIWYTKADKQKAKEIMEQLELYSIRKKCFNELSGGQKQRVLIARALCSTEKIILLDEPVNGLDPKIATQIYEILYKLNKEKGLTIVMVSHDIDRALNYSSRVIELENGKIIKDVIASEYKAGGAK